MKIRYSWILAGLFAVLLAACATASREAPIAYDLGPLRAERTALPSGMQPFLLAEIQAPEWLDGTAMHYRLDYANNQRAHAYAHSRWSMPPAKLIEQRLKSRIAAAGGVALAASNDVTSGTLLKIELDDFAQRFETSDNSVGRVELRVSAFKGRTLLAQKTFVRTVSAPSADAAGGSKALALASDELIGEVLVWLAGLGVNG